jgi:hypothetical protein
MRLLGVHISPTLSKRCKLRREIGGVFCFMDKLGIAFLRAFHLMFVVTPLLTSVALYAFAWRASILLGHWPIPMFDDPKNFGDDDPLYVQLGGVADFFVLSCLVLILLSLPFLGSLFLGNFSARYRWGISVAAALAWGFALLCDFGNVGAWYLD